MNCSKKVIHELFVKISCFNFNRNNIDYLTKAHKQVEDITCRKLETAILMHRMLLQVKYLIAFFPLPGSHPNFIYSSVRNNNYLSTEYSKIKLIDLSLSHFVLISGYCLTLLLNFKWDLILIIYLSLTFFYSENVFIYIHIHVHIHI